MLRLFQTMRVTELNFYREVEISLKCWIRFILMLRPEMEKPGLIFVSSKDIHQDQVINITNTRLAITNTRNSTSASRQKSADKALNNSREAEEARATADETSSNAMGNAIGVDQRWESSE